MIKVILKVAFCAVDGTLNHVVSGTKNQIDERLKFLQQEEVENNIVYGFHITHGSILSCYVEDHNEKHIHFVDGTEGGFTAAAKVLKPKLKYS